jgi:hypothetical protein
LRGQLGRGQERRGRHACGVVGDLSGVCFFAPAWLFWSCACSSCPCAAATSVLPSVDRVSRIASVDKGCFRHTTIGPKLVSCLTDNWTSTALGVIPFRGKKHRVTITF